MSSVANRRSIVSFPSYLDFFGSQIYPTCTKSTIVGIFIVLIYFIYKIILFGANYSFAAHSLGYLLGIAFLIAMIFVYHLPNSNNLKALYVIIFGNLSVLSLCAGNVFSHFQPSSIIHIILVFMFGALIIAPLLTVPVFLIPNTILNIFLLFCFKLGNISMENIINLMLFSFSSSFFLSFIIIYLRSSALRYYETARENYLYSNLDMLSQLLNRRAWYKNCDEACKRTKTTNESIAFIMLDIDYFKKINDTYGHDCGDIVIKHVSDTLLYNTRETDFVGRLGGEEFGILITSAQAEEALMAAERIRGAIENLTIVYNNIILKITASIGVVSGTIDSLDKLVKCGDECLYRAKNQGRNRVVYQEI